MNKLLSVYAHVMCRAIWAARTILPAKDGGLPDIPILRRDWEWTSDHLCENCGHRGRHRFIEWLPEQVVTATCGRCGFEGTL